MHTTATDTTVAPRRDEAAQVARWRFGQLLQAGYSIAEAVQIADRTDVDLHVARSLVQRGCPTGTALRILL